MVEQKLMSRHPEILNLKAKSHSRDKKESSTTFNGNPIRVVQKS